MYEKKTQKGISFCAQLSMETGITRKDEKGSRAKDDIEPVEPADF